MRLSRPALRRFWFNVHLWLGLGVLVLMIPECVSGSYLVWHNEIDRVFHSERFAVADPEIRLPPSSYIAAAQAAFGKRAQAYTLAMPEIKGDPVTVAGLAPAENDREERWTQGKAWLDPGSGRVLAAADLSTSVTSFMRSLHGVFLLPPSIGSPVVEALGWILFISSLTGIYLWWPRAGFLKGFRWRRTPTTNMNLHYLSGILMAVPLALLAATGPYYIPRAANSIANLIEGTPASPLRRPPPPRAVLSDAPASADRIVARAREESDGGQLRLLTLPTETNRTWQMQFKMPSSTSDIPRMDRETVVARVPVATETVTIARPGYTPMRIADNFNAAVHWGLDAGLLWRFIITVAGIAPVLFGVTGFIAWTRRETRKRATAKRVAVA